MLKIGHELPFIAPFVFNHIPGAISSKVVHHKHPTTRPIPRGERHLGVDWPRIRHERSQPAFVRDETDCEVRGNESVIDLAAQSRITTSTARHDVHVRQDDLVTVTVWSRASATVQDEVEPQPHLVHAHHEIADLTGVTVPPKCVGCVPLREPPVASNARCTTDTLRAAEFIKAPTSVDVRHEFNVWSRLFERVFAGVTFQHERRELTLQHLRCQHEHVGRWHRTIEEDFLVSNCRENKRERVKRAVGRQFLASVQKRPFAQERALNRARGRPQNVRDNLLELFLGMSDVHELIETQQRRRPALLFQIIRNSIRAPTDHMFVFVARRSQTPGILRPVPFLGGVREHMPELVQPTFNSDTRWERARGYVVDPGIGGTNVVNYHFVVVRLLVHKPLRKIAAGIYQLIRRPRREAVMTSLMIPGRRTHNATLHLGFAEASLSFRLVDCPPLEPMNFFQARTS